MQIVQVLPCGSFFWCELWSLVKVEDGCMAWGEASIKYSTATLARRLDCPPLRNLTVWTCSSDRFAKLDEKSLDVTCHFGNRDTRLNNAEQRRNNSRFRSPSTWRSSTGIPQVQLLLSSSLAAFCAVPSLSRSSDSESARFVPACMHIVFCSNIPSIGR